MQNLDQNQSANEEHTVQTLETELEKMKQEKCEQQRMIDELNIQMNEYKEQNLKLKEQLCEETEKNAQHRTSIEYLESDFQMLLNKIEKLHAQIENLKRDLEIANNIVCLLNFFSCTLLVFCK